jgi:hypothetical protein
VITWARAVEERLDRRPPSRHSGKMRNQGLVPALKPLRLKKRVELLVKQLRAGPVGECRLLANFTLHDALVRNPFAGAQLTADGAMTLPIPDPPAHPINHWYLFTWNDGRDGIAFAEEVWKSIQVFIDDLLNAFEKAVPKRLRPQKGPWPGGHRHALPRRSPPPARRVFSSSLKHAKRPHKSRARPRW